MTIKSIPITPVRGTQGARSWPAEWAPQSGVMLTWPRRQGPWGTERAPVERVFLDLAREIAWREPVLMVVEDQAQQHEIAAALATEGVAPERLRFACVPSNDVWARDHGPVTIARDGRPVLLDFRFNGWGGKYQSDQDDQITQRLHEARVFGAVPMEPVSLVLEGGSIESDGMGTVLTTSRCLLSPARNPTLDRDAIARELAALLGAGRTLWLEHGYLAGDDTDSHIDTLARFCDPDTIAYVACPDPEDEHYEELSLMAGELQALRTLRGMPYRLVPLPWPRAKLNAEGERLPATYANFLIINDAVLVPTYDDPADAEALAVLARCFPDREVMGIHALPLIRQYGSLHCVSMQLPLGVLK